MSFTFPRPTISLDSELRNSVRSYREGGSRYVQRKERRRWGREGSPEGDRSGPSGHRSREGRWSARRKMTVVLELLRGAELEATSRKRENRGRC